MTMRLIAPEFARAFDGKPRRKKNITGDIYYQSAREKARQLCTYSREVMVKITSYGKGAGRTWDNLGYISRLTVPDKEDLDLETDRGEILSGEKAIREYVKGWEQDYGKPNKNRRDTMRLMLSMPPGTNREAVRKATREFARETFGRNHEYVFVLHTDEPHPHCHLTVKMLGHNGKKLDPGKEDLANWRDRFAHELRQQGVDAIATRRATRGVVRKAEKTAVHRMQQDGRLPKVVVRRELEAIAALKAEAQGQQVEPGPWVAPIVAEQAAVRHALLAAADELERGPPPLFFLSEGQHARLQAVQTTAAAYQAGIDPRRAVDPRNAPPRTSIGTTAGIPTLAQLRVIDVSARPTVAREPTAFLPEDHHDRITHAQQDGAAYQVRLATPRAGEPPRPVADLAALPRIKPAHYGMPLRWRQRRPLTMGSTASIPTLASLHAPSRSEPRSHIPTPLLFTQEVQHERANRHQYAAAVYQSNLATPHKPATHSTPSLRDLPRLDVVRHGTPRQPNTQMLLQQDARYLMGKRAGANTPVRREGAGPAGDRPGTGGEGRAQRGESAARGGAGSRQGGTAEGTGGAAERARGTQGRSKGAAEIDWFQPRVASAPSYRSIGTVAGVPKLSDVVATASGDKALAVQIRSFVANMPPVETARDILKRQLAEQFTVPAQVVPQAVPASKPESAPAAAPDAGRKKGAKPSAPKL